MIVWVVGASGDQRLHGYDGDSGTVVYAGGGTNELMAGTHSYSTTGIVARGRIYVATDNKVYAFRLPGGGAHTYSNVNFYPDAESNIYSEADTDPHTHSDRNANCDTHSDLHPDGNSNCDSTANCDTYSHLDTYGYSDFDSNANSHVVSYAVANSNARCNAHS